MSAISMPFRIDDIGRVATTSDVYRVWADRVRSVVSTTPGERLMRPTYGCNLTHELFDSIEMAPDLIDNDINASFAQWLPTLNFSEVVLTSEDPGNGAIDVNVVYEVPSSPENQQSVDIHLVLN